LKEKIVPIVCIKPKNEGDVIKETTIQMRASIELKELIKVRADENGWTITQFIVNAVLEKVERDKDGTCTI